MTTRPAAPPPGAAKIIQFPDPPPEEMTGYYSISNNSYPESLRAHFGNPETTVITSEVAAALIPTENYEGVRYPDLLIAFNVDPQASEARLGYLIPEQGKPPDFVLEVASRSTGRQDETVKRDDYAAMGVPEYWRFDPSGGLYHQAALAGDRLSGGAYESIPIHRPEAGHWWGHSAALNLDLCWEAGQLRFWDPISRRYLNTFTDERAEHMREREARLAAEARIRELEAELRRRPPG